MAALRAGVSTVIIPKENESDLEEIDPLVRARLNFVAVEHADEVLDLVFPQQEDAKGNGKAQDGRQTAAVETVSV